MSPARTPSVRKERERVKTKNFLVRRERESWEVDMKVKVKGRMIAIWMKFTASLVSRETE